MTNGIIEASPRQAVGKLYCKVVFNFLFARQPLSKLKGNALAVQFNHPLQPMHIKKSWYRRMPAPALLKRTQRLQSDFQAEKVVGIEIAHVTIGIVETDVELVKSLHQANAKTQTTSAGSITIQRTAKIILILV